MPAATNMGSTTIKFCPVVINLIMFIEQKPKALRYLSNSKLGKKKKINRGNFDVYVTVTFRKMSFPVTP